MATGVALDRELTNRPLDQPLDEALRLIRQAGLHGLQVRLIGGLAFRARCPEWSAGAQRPHHDIDLATRSKDRRALGELLEACGYVGDREYNAVHGDRQLYFVDPAHARPLDVLVDRMEMSHAFAFADRLEVDPVTLPLAELLLSKLQVARINRKDILDALALLSDYPLSYRADRGIDMDRVTRLTSRDWGWWRTTTGNLEILARFVRSELQPGELEFGRPPRFDALEQVRQLRAAVDATPKGLHWRLRAGIGDRMPWFEEPEEIPHSG